jgi:hypothetical protein
MSDAPKTLIVLGVECRVIACREPFTGRWESRGVIVTYGPTWDPTKWVVVAYPPKTTGIRGEGLTLRSAEAQCRRRLRAVARACLAIAERGV